jgi:phenylpropionate dioxygenase-like ring-hydroxylating dioxygenase large terminal subunit
MSRAELLRMARRNLAHVKAGTIDLEPEVLRVPAAHYFDPARAERELARIWRRLPLVLALSAELREPGDFRALESAGVPVLVTRGSDGAVRAFLNSCAHRGAQIVTEPCGNARRFTCPYHAWSYDENGALTGVSARADFGEVDPARQGLVRLPAAERAGFVFVSLAEEPALDLDTFLCGYGGVLAEFGFERWRLVARRSVPGPSWKIAYDGYLDFYHLPVLHKATIGSGLPNRALYDAYGPHQRVSFPNPGLLRFEDRPEDEWDARELRAGVWTIFPHVSIATFDVGAPAVLVSQLFPGASPLESVTVQSFLMESEPDDAARAAAEKTFALLGHVVREEDYATGRRQQRALQAGLRPEVLFGRNEGGGQRFHRFVDRVLALPDERLASAFGPADRHEPADPA